jgi:type II secretory pathway pseudopilin PulG
VHAGFTIAETLVAMGVSVTLLATLVPVYFQAVTSTLTAHGQSMATMLAAAKLEQLRGLTFGVEDAGAAGLLRVTDTVTDLTRPGLSAGGAGLSPSPPGTLLRDVDGFVDYADAAGRWVGSALAPGSAAAYARRWAITPLPASPDDAVVLQVVVVPLASERRAGPRTTATRRPGDAWLTLVRARTR